MAIPSPIGIGIGVGPAVGVASGVYVGVGEVPCSGVADGATVVGVGTTTTVGTGTVVVDCLSGVISAVIDHDVPRAEIVPVFPSNVSIPPRITVDPSLLGTAVTVIVVS